MELITRSRGTQIPLHAQRVFFCCDEKNNTQEREQIISDLLSMDAGMDCAVTYIKDSGEHIDTDELRNTMQEMQLLVLWVTVEMLQSINIENSPIALELAKELHLPILPILDSNGLYDIFNEKVGQLHCIIRLSNDSYRTDLKTQLEKYLASDELIEHIHANAFTASIFVAYRKKEVDKLKGFLQIFHNLAGFETISIFYDSFLTAGRNFSNEIKEAIEKSNVFAMMVTPLLASNDHNYVQEIEYPFAQKNNKQIVAVAVEETDKRLFAEVFPESGELVPMTSGKELRAAFCNAFNNALGNTLDNAFGNTLGNALSNILGNAPISEEIGDTQAYLLGMAYLKSIGVERDFFRAVRLLETAAEYCSFQGLNAANQLADIFENGSGTSINYKKALEWRIRAGDYCEKLLGKEHADTATTFNNTAVVYSRLNEYGKALELYEKALSIREKQFGKEHPITAATCHNIAELYGNLGKYKDALEWYGNALEIREKLLGREHLNTATTCHNIAGIYSHLGEHEYALRWCDRALSIREKLLGKEHPDTAATYHEIAFIFSRLGEYGKALEWYDKALAINEKVLGYEHPTTAAAYHNIAGIYYQAGEYGRSLEWYERALEINEKLLGKEHTSTAATYHNIAGIYTCLGEFDKALEWYGKALDICEKLLGEEHPSTATTCNNIAEVYSLQGEYGKALKWHERALVTNETILGEEHSDTITNYNNIAFMHSRLGEYHNALKWYEKALAITERALGREHSSVDVASAAVASTVASPSASVASAAAASSTATISSTSAFSAASSVASTDDDESSASFTAYSYKSATICSNIAGVYYHLSEYTNALEWYARALAIREKLSGKGHPGNAHICENIAEVYSRQGEYKKALAWYENALEIIEKVLSKEDPILITLENKIAAVKAAIST